MADLCAACTYLIFPPPVLTVIIYNIVFVDISDAKHEAP